MSLSSLCRSAVCPRNWGVNASLAGLFSLLLLVSAGAVGISIFDQIEAMSVEKEEPGWPLFLLGYNYQRLLLAAERGTDEAEIRLRGDIYLGQVIMVRDAPFLAEIRAGAMQEPLAALWRSAETTSRLLEHVESRPQRWELMMQLRADEKLVRGITVDMSALARHIASAERAAQVKALLFYLSIMAVLLVSLFGLGLFTLWTLRRLHRAQDKLSKQITSQDAILGAVDDAIIGFCMERDVVYANPSARALLGRHAEAGASSMGNSSLEAGLAGSLQSFVMEPDEPGYQGLLGTFRVEIDTDDGARHYMLRKFRTAFADCPTPEESSFIVTIADVTAEEEAARRRKESDAKIAEASRLLAFAAISGGIVHEISQPLAAIRNYIHALKVSFQIRLGTEDQRAITEHLGEEVDRAIEVVRSVRLMGPQEQQDDGACDLDEVIAHSLRLVTLGANPPPSIAITAEQAARLRVKGSLPLMGQVIINLLKNALQASAAAGRSGAEIMLRQHGDCAEIAVADFGKGVSPEAAKSLFSPFSKSSRGGMGLGLAICQRIAANIGGSLSWENRPAGGALFKFTIPLAAKGNPA